MAACLEWLSVTKEWQTNGNLFEKTLNLLKVKNIVMRNYGDTLIRVQRLKVFYSAGKTILTFYLYLEVVNGWSFKTYNGKKSFQRNWTKKHSDRVEQYHNRIYWCWKLSIDFFEHLFCLDWYFYLLIKRKPRYVSCWDFHLDEWRIINTFLSHIKY